jgi:hypothetical protein
MLLVESQQRKISELCGDAHTEDVPPPVITATFPSRQSERKGDDDDDDDDDDIMGKNYCSRLLRGGYRTILQSSTTPTTDQENEE